MWGTIWRLRPRESRGDSHRHDPPPESLGGALPAQFSDDPVVGQFFDGQVEKILQLQVVD